MGFDSPQQVDSEDGSEQAGTVAGDINGDGVADAEDFRVFADVFNTAQGEDGFRPDLDFDEDGVISLVDYQIWYDLVFSDQP